MTTAQLDEVWRRSGHNGVFFRALGKEEFAIVKLPKLDTLAEARAKAAKLGLMAYGLIPTHGGFAIRVKEVDKIAMEKALMPQYTTAVGDERMQLQKR